MIHRRDDLITQFNADEQSYRDEHKKQPEKENIVECPDTGGPDYRCVMCDKPLPVGCKDCTEYAYEAVGYPTLRSKIEALPPHVFDSPIDQPHANDGLFLRREAVLALLDVTGQ